MKWYLYIVKCSDESLYTGITLDIKRRINQHNAKKGAKSLIWKLPVVLMYNEEHVDHRSAAKREIEIKSWKRERKLKLIGAK